MGVKKLPTGGWEASYRDSGGRERIKRHRTRNAADRWLAGVKTDIQRGDYIDPRLARTRLSEWAEEWLSTTVHLKLKTQTGYESMLRTHVLPAFGDTAVAAIGPRRRPPLRGHDDRERLGSRDSALRTQGAASRAGHSRGGWRHQEQSLQRCPGPPFAADRDGVPERRAGRVTPPFGTLIRVAAYTGMRAGELEALRVGRLELLKSRPVVAESVTEVHGHGMVFGPTKTYERRTIPLMPSIRDELGALLATRP